MVGFFQKQEFFTAELIKTCLQHSENYSVHLADSIFLQNEWILLSFEEDCSYMDVIEFQQYVLSTALLLQVSFWWLLFCNWIKGKNLFEFYDLQLRGTSEICVGVVLSILADLYQGFLITYLIHLKTTRGYW